MKHRALVVTAFDVLQEIGHAVRRFFLVQFQHDLAHAGFQGHVGRGVEGGRRSGCHDGAAQGQAGKQGAKTGQERQAFRFDFLHEGVLDRYFSLNLL
ncbi:hypothetical protein D3C72_1615980 [compost metagenome]